MGRRKQSTRTSIILTGKVTLKSWLGTFCPCFLKDNTSSRLHTSYLHVKEILGNKLHTEILIT